MHVSGKKQNMFDVVMTKGKSTSKAIESDDSDEQDPELLFGEDKLFAQGAEIEYNKVTDISSTVKTTKSKQNTVL